MSETLEKMAAEIRAKFKECGSVVFWGSLMVQPHEVIYDLQRVEMAGSKLTFHLAAKDDGSPMRIDVVRPRGLKIERINALVIDGADELWLDGRRASPGDRVPALILD